MKMQYPKKHTSEQVQFSEFDCRTVNLHQGIKYNYWFIEGAKRQPIRLLKGKIPKMLKRKDIGELKSQIQ